jgi:high-affinity iron transporter
MWDTSWLIPESSTIGAILHALIGYSDRPSGIQLAFYVATLVTILSAQRVVNHGANWKLKPATAAALIAGTWASVAAVSAYAQVGI